MGESREEEMRNQERFQRSVGCSAVFLGGAMILAGLIAFRQAWERFAGDVTIDSEYIRLSLTCGSVFWASGFTLAVLGIWAIVKTTRVNLMSFSINQPDVAWPMAAFIGMCVGASAAATTLAIGAVCVNINKGIVEICLSGATAGSVAGAISASDGIARICRNAFIIGLISALTSLVTRCVA